MHTFRGTSSTRTKLVQCTAQLIQQRGYFALRTADIISNTGVPKGSLYHHFPGGKAELAIEAATTELTIFHATQKAYADIAIELASLIGAAGMSGRNADRLASLTLSVIEGATTVSRVMQNRDALEEAALCLSEQINRYAN